MNDSYLEKLENILEGVENYRYDDMSCAEWEELTKYVLKGAIAREKANQEADKLACSAWSKLANLSEPTLNENQQIVLEWLKEQYAESNLFPIEVTWLLFESVDNGYFEPEEERAFENLNNLEEAQVLQAFASWVEQEEIND